MSELHRQTQKVLNEEYMAVKAKAKAIDEREKEMDAKLKEI